MVETKKHTLKLRRVAIDTYKENVAYLHRDRHLYRSEGFQALAKVEINGENGGGSLLATLNVVDDHTITTPDELGLSLQAFDQIGLPEGAAASVAHAPPPTSLHAVHRKIAVERPLSIDSPGQLVASILAKKVAAGATHLLVDIPMGPTTKVRSQTDALRLRKMFEFVGDRVGLKVEVMITDGHQPIGRGIGPVLEARDVMQVLHNDPDQPRDLREKALQLASRILEFDPDVRGGQGYTLARDIVESGRALAKLQAIIDAQGPSGTPREVGHLCRTIEAERDGRVATIDNLQMAHIARLAGAPMDKGAGVDLYRKVGDRVREGDPLYAIHAEFDADFRFACEAARQNSGFGLTT